MSSAFHKDELTWRDILIRSAIIIISVVIVVWAMPHDNRSYFHVEEGKPWKYADFTAPFDFPVYKSEAAIKEERDSAMRNYEPYYNHNKEVEMRMVKKFNTDYADGIPGLPKSFVEIISNRLHSLYQQGIMEQEEYAKLRKDTAQMIRVVIGKEASSISILEVYSAKTAYEQLFTEDQLSMFRPILQKCNLNAYIMPNLIYDQERSESSKNDLLSGIALASGLVQKGQKIVGRGEIVTEKTYRIIESFKRENELRNEDVTQNRISLLGQILYVTILMVCFTLYLTLYRKDYFENPRSIAMLYTLIMIFVLLTALFMRNSFIHIYILPYAMVPIIIRVFMDSRTAEFIVIQLIAGLAAITSLRELSQRSQLFKSAIIITLASMFVNLAFDWMKADALMQIDLSTYNYLIANGIALLFAYPLLFLIEKAFGFTSDISLIELSNTNNELLRQMSEVAPGTFNHSIQVANLAGEIANKIGAKASQQDWCQSPVGTYRSPLPRHRQIGQPHLLYGKPVGH